MIYRVRHSTTYDYEDPVSVSHHVVRLRPRASASQTCKSSTLRIDPAPATSTSDDDYFGNRVTHFTLHEPHERLTVEAISEVEVHPPAHSDFATSPPWNTVQADLAAVQYTFDSKYCAANEDLATYAKEVFAEGRPILEAALALTQQIYRDFRFDAEATEISTPVAEVFKNRRGVCQDFAHLEVATLRSLGLPARYVSGYLRTLPPPGRPRLIGADASHAWCALWCHGTGWIDFDPTNNCVPSDGHITVAWGRDYGDVSPIYGVLLGGAHHTLEVGVDVEPVG